MKPLSPRQPAEHPTQSEPGDFFEQAVYACENCDSRLSAELIDAVEAFGRSLRDRKRAEQIMHASAEQARTILRGVEMARQLMRNVDEAQPQIGGAS